MWRGALCALLLVPREALMGEVQLVAVLATTTMKPLIFKSLVLLCLEVVHGALLANHLLLVCPAGKVLVPLRLSAVTRENDGSPELFANIKTFIDN